MKHCCLFSAPSAFMPEIRDEFNGVISTVFKEAWYLSDLPDTRSFTAWIVNPSGHFLIDGTVLERFPNLQLLITPSTGRNHIEICACQEKGVSVYSLLDDRAALNKISASAEFTFLLLLNAWRRLDRILPETTARLWRKNEDRMRGFEIAGKKIGLVGFGRIGKKMARYCRAFGAEVSFHDPHVRSRRFQAKTLERIFSESDAVCVCCQLNDKTRGMVTRRYLEKLKKNAVFVNTSRGEVVREKDLEMVIRKRPDLSVALDVLAGEVDSSHLRSSLLKLHDQGKIVISPHIAGATVESQKKAALISLSLLKKKISREGHLPRK